MPSFAAVRWAVVINKLGECDELCIQRPCNSHQPLTSAHNAAYGSHFMQADDKEPE
jgi:hypothetical protein